MIKCAGSYLSIYVSFRKAQWWGEMVQHDDSYHSLFLLPNQAGFVFTHLLIIIFGLSYLKIFRDRSLGSHDSGPVKLFAASKFRFFYHCPGKVFFGVIKSSLSLSCGADFYQPLINIVDVLSSKKLNFEPYKSEKI